MKFRTAGYLFLGLTIISSISLAITAQLFIIGKIARCAGEAGDIEKKCSDKGGSADLCRHIGDRAFSDCMTTMGEEIGIEIPIFVKGVFSLGGSLSPDADESENERAFTATVAQKGILVVSGRDLMTQRVRMSPIRVVLNNEEVISERDFRGNEEYVYKEISLMEGINIMRVETIGKGSDPFWRAYVVITGEVPPI